MINKLYLEKVIIGETKYLYESSLSRLATHTSKGFFIISAFRKEYSEPDNLKRHLKLQADLRGHGLGFIQVYDKWIEDEGKPTEKLVSELSLFVPYNPKSIKSYENFYAIATDLSDKYDQDAIVYKEEESDIVVLDDAKNEVYSVGKFNPDKIGEVYSTLKYGKHAGRNFKFEGTIKPSGSNHALLMRKQGNII